MSDDGVVRDFRAAVRLFRAQTVPAMAPACLSMAPGKQKKLDSGDPVSRTPALTGQPLSHSQQSTADRLTDHCWPFGWQLAVGAFFPAATRRHLPGEERRRSIFAQDGIASAESREGRGRRASRCLGCSGLLSGCRTTEQASAGDLREGNFWTGDTGETGESVALALYLHLADGGTLRLDGTSLFLDPKLQALGVCPALAARQNKRGKKNLKVATCSLAVSRLFVRLWRPMRNC